MADLEIIYSEPQVYQHFPSFKVLHWQEPKLVVSKLSYFEVYNFLFFTLCDLGEFIKLYHHHHHLLNKNTLLPGYE